MGFIFGESTPWTYDEVQRKRKIAEAMAGQIGSPRNVGEGLSAIGKALAVRGIEKRADRRMGELQGEADKAWEGVFGALTGGRTGGGRTYSAPYPTVRTQSEEEGVASDTMSVLNRVRGEKGVEPIINPKDREILARTLQAEAGSEGFDGMVAVGSVIANRKNSGQYGENWEDVIMAPGQFSAWNSVTGYAGGEQGQDMNFTPNEDALRAADAILTGNYSDPTNGARNYFNPAISQPAWGQSGEWDRIGNHVFGTAAGGVSSGGGRTSPGGQNSLQAIAAAMSNPIIRNDPGKMAILQAMMGQALTPPKNPWDVRSVGDELVRVNAATGQVEPLYVGQDSPLVSNTINSGIDTSELDKTLDKREGDLWGTYLEAGNNSAAMQSDMEALMQLAQIAPQGPLVGRLAEAFPGFSSAGAAFNSIVKRLAPTMRATGSGSTSDIEYQGMLDSLPKLVNRPEANVVIAQMMSNKARINMERAEVIRAYRNKEIGVREARSRISQIDQQSIMTPEMAALLRQAEPQTTEGDGFRDVGDGVSIRRKD